MMLSGTLSFMQERITERVAKLRREIAQINEANRQYLRDSKRIPAAASDHERRSQRLQEIMEELAALTDWKKI